MRLRGGLNEQVARLLLRGVTFEDALRKRERQPRRLELAMAKTDEEYIDHLIVLDEMRLDRSSVISVHVHQHFGLAVPGDPVPLTAESVMR